MKFPQTTVAAAMLLVQVVKLLWEGSSHDAFHDAFAAFPWEVLDVFSGPPKVAFTWRHWAEFT
jgi:hypothetical protein